MLACCALLLTPHVGVRCPQLHTPPPVDTRAPEFVMRAPEAPPSRQLELPLLLRAEPALAIGSALLLLLVANRLVTSELLNSQSRADLIATIAPVLIILKALTDLDITPKVEEAVPPMGTPGEWVEASLPAGARAEVEWAAETLLGIDSCCAVALWRDERTLMLRGTLGRSVTPGSDAISAGPLLTKAAARVNGAPDYLPALQLLPGRVEFNYFPDNAQGLLMLPLVGATRGALLMACDRKRGFGPDDVEWARAVAARVAERLDQ